MTIVVVNKEFELFSGQPTQEVRLMSMSSTPPAKWDDSDTPYIVAMSLCSGGIYARHTHIYIYIYMYMCVCVLATRPAVCGSGKWAHLAACRLCSRGCLGAGGLRGHRRCRALAGEPMVAGTQ